VGIVTLKISPHEPQRAVVESLRLLERVYDILFARQLFHNRNEVTVVCQVRV
jgi:23S rRNA (cytidine2498-2'-O)-methyltransferase